MVTAYPVQACITEITGPASGNLVIRPTWCHSLFWNQTPLGQCSTAVALWTRARPPAGAASPGSPQSAGFLPTTSHSSARPAAPRCCCCCCPPGWRWSTGLPWSVMHPWMFCKFASAGGRRTRKKHQNGCGTSIYSYAIDTPGGGFNQNSERIISSHPELSEFFPTIFWYFVAKLCIQVQKASAGSYTVVKTTL